MAPCRGSLLQVGLLSRRRVRLRRRWLLADRASWGPAAALLVLVGVLVAVASSAPLFQRAAAQAAWEQERSRLGEVTPAATFRTGTIARDSVSAQVERVRRVPALDAAVRQEAADLGLREPVALTALFGDADASGPAGSTAIDVISRDGAAEQVQVLAGAPLADGALVPVRAAAALGVGPGDTLLVNDAVRVPVVGHLPGRHGAAAALLAGAG